MKKVAIYAGTFDPMTLGHVDIAERAAKLFDQVIVAVAPSERKSTLLTFEQRLQLAEDVLSKQENIVVRELRGLSVDFAQQQHAQVLIRGVRCGSDADYEMQIAGMNHAMAPDIETIYLPAAAEYSKLSSTMIREIVREWVVM